MTENHSFLGQNYFNKFWKFLRAVLGAGGQAQSFFACSLPFDFPALVNLSWARGVEFARSPPFCSISSSDYSKLQENVRVVFFLFGFFVLTLLQFHSLAISFTLKLLFAFWHVWTRDFSPAQQTIRVCGWWVFDDSKTESALVGCLPCEHFATFFIRESPNRSRIPQTVNYSAKLNFELRFRLMAPWEHMSQHMSQAVFCLKDFCFVTPQNVSKTGNFGLKSQILKLKAKSRVEKAKRAKQKCETEASFEMTMKKSKKNKGVF